MKLNEQSIMISPDPKNPALTADFEGLDHLGNRMEMKVVQERALTLFLNSREIVTLMTVGDFPELLAIGYLVNQNMIAADDIILEVEYDDDVEVIVVRTEKDTNFEEKMKKRVRTSGCAQGTIFADVMNSFEKVKLSQTAQIKTSWLYTLTKTINTLPSLYLETGAIHGCVLCKEDQPLVYMEDVGRHNAVDKIAGWLYQEKETTDDKIFYTTGRLTSEMVIKTVMMGIPILVSRSGFTASGVSLAREAGLTLIGRARGKRFIAVSGEDRIIFDADPAFVADEDPKHARKSANK